MPWIAAGIFTLAVLHTFSTKYFEHLAHTHPRHAGIWHLLGEVEVVFGLWAMVLAIAMFAMVGSVPTLEYLESRDFTEPLFVFAIMVVAGTRPILQFCSQLVHQLASRTPLPTAMVNYFLLLSVVPLLGSLITEPAAMTLAALLLGCCLSMSPLVARSPTLRHRLCSWWPTPGSGTCPSCSRPLAGRQALRRFLTQPF
jgi:hypothetical protein